MYKSKLLFCFVLSENDERAHSTENNLYYKKNQQKMLKIFKLSYYN